MRKEEQPLAANMLRELSEAYHDYQHRADNASCEEHRVYWSTKAENARQRAATLREVTA